MANSYNPFQDPELLAAMQQHGVVHKPGMAAQHLQEIAPLLKAEGIDLNDLDGSNPNMTLEQLNAAVARANEQRNLSLFTPIGRDRMNALTYLRTVAWLVSNGKHEAAMRVLDIIAPEETEAIPAGSHMIGVSLGLLDSWLGDAEATQALPVVRVPKFRGKTPAIARDLIALARKGRAFDSHSRFIVQHGGEELMRGGAFAVAAVVTQVALRDKVSIHQAFEGLEYALQTPGLSPVVYRATDFRPEPAREMGEAYKKRFASWVDNGTLPEDFVREELDLFDELECRALARRLDIHESQGLTDMIDVVEKTRVGHSRFYDYEVLENYARFRQDDAGFVTSNLDTAAETPGALWWNLASELGSRVTPYREAEAAELAAENAADTENAAGYYAGLEDPNWSEEQRYELDALIEEIPVITGLFDMIEWLDQPRQVTATGGVRRADIAEVAAMIGVRAEGVAKEPAGARSLSARRDPDRVIYARSMDGVPGLVDWWFALQAAGAIEVTKTRVRRGPAVSEGGGVGHDTMLRVLAEYMVEVASDRVDADAHQTTMTACEVTLQLLARCLKTGIDVVEFDRNTSEDLKLDHEQPLPPQMGEQMAWKRLLVFERAGALERGPGARLQVVPMLRGAVQYALETAAARYNLAVS